MFVLKVLNTLEGVVWLTTLRLARETIEAKREGVNKINIIGVTDDLVFPII